MKAKIKEIKVSQPFGASLDEISFSDGDSFCVPLLVYIGPENEEGDDGFDFVFVSPKYLADRVATYGYTTAENCIVLNALDEKIILTILDEIVAKANGPRWHAVAHYLDGFGRWEFRNWVDSHKGPSE